MIFSVSEMVPFKDARFLVLIELPFPMVFC